MPRVTRKTQGKTEFQIQEFVTWFNRESDNPLILAFDHKGGRWLGKRNRTIFQNDPRPSWVGYMEFSEGTLKLYLHEHYFDEHIGRLYQLATRYEDRHSHLPIEIIEIVEL